MTEKRFRVVCGDTDWYIEDKLISPFAVLTPHQASDLLNILHEENMELKSENNMLKVTIGRNEALSKLQKENNEIKQLIHTMLVQIDIEKINTENARYSARIIFTFEEFQKMREIWKGDLK